MAIYYIYTADSTSLHPPTQSAMDTTPHHHLTRRPPPPPKQQRRKRDESLKVVYISTPMKVRTSAARFRSLVQHLTGKNSDIAPYMDGGGAFVDYRDEDGTLLPDRVPSSASVSSDDTAATSDSADNTFASAAAVRFEEQFRGFFSSELSPMDVLGSYDDLIM